MARSESWFSRVFLGFFQAALQAMAGLVFGLLTAPFRALFGADAVPAARTETLKPEQQAEEQASAPAPAASDGSPPR